ncbi:hypothetical protein BJX76DRAFT_345019 [Aspergillus varians]
MSERFDRLTAFSPRDKDSESYDDGREFELLEFVKSHPDLESVRGSPHKVLNLIDQYERTKKCLLKLNNDKARMICTLIADVKPKTMVSPRSTTGLVDISARGKATRRSGLTVLQVEMGGYFAEIAGSLIELAGLSDVVKVIVGSSAASTGCLCWIGLKQIDILFLGHDKPAYTPTLKLCEELFLIAPGSWLVADNVFWPGNYPYLEYVMLRVIEKKTNLARTESAKSEYKPCTIMDLHNKIYGEMNPDLTPGNPNLVYVTKLVEGSGPTNDRRCSIFLSTVPNASNPNPEI